MPISNILNLSKQALLSHQSAIDTTSNNISNMNTKGYTRRLTNFDQGLGINQISKNVSDEVVSRVRNSFLEKQFIHQNSYSAKYSMDNTIAKQIEDILSEPGEAGLSHSLSDFWMAWSDLANNPESQSVRTVVKDKSQALVNTFNRVYNDLHQLQNSIKDNLSNKVDSINQKLKQINKINNQLNSNKSDDLLDQRDSLLSELSELINIETNFGENGRVSIYSNGQILVSGSQPSELRLEKKKDGSGLLQIKAGNMEDGIRVKAGEIGSILSMHNKNIPDYIEKLNTLATNLSQEVNKVHRSGYNLDDITGINFFADNITTAGDFRLNEKIVAEPGLIATSDEAGEPGNNNIAQSINNLRSEKIIKGVRPEDFYGAFVTEIGSKVQEAEYLSSSQEKVVKTIQNQRDSSSGVSLDEEMINLTKYEQGYQAAAKVVNTVNDMMYTVLNLIQ
jgi:flagellar hook-associated protein 1 FlgK